MKVLQVLSLNSFNDRGTTKKTWDFHAAEDAEHSEKWHRKVECVNGGSRSFAQL